MYSAASLTPDRRVREYETNRGITGWWSPGTFTNRLYIGPGRERQSRPSATIRPETGRDTTSSVKRVVYRVYSPHENLMSAGVQSPPLPPCWPTRGEARIRPPVWANQPKS